MLKGGWLAGDYVNLWGEGLVTPENSLWPSVMRGADDQDRTGMASLEGWGSTIELHPRVLNTVFNTVIPIRKI